jgi:hypothetical protein
MADENTWDFEGDPFMFLMSLNFTLGKSILK